jgi:hypothetical protein
MGSVGDAQRVLHLATMATCPSPNQLDKYWGSRRLSDKQVVATSVYSTQVQAAFNVRVPAVQAQLHNAWGSSSASKRP